MSISGTPRKVVINGISYDVFADTNITYAPSKNEREGIPTTGRTIQKMVKRIPTKEGITIAADSAELAQLKKDNESLPSKTLSVEYADGSTYRATGQFNLESWENEENKATIIMIPDQDWTLFEP